VQGISGGTAIEVERTLLSVQRWSLDDEAWASVWRALESLDAALRAGVEGEVSGAIDGLIALGPTRLGAVRFDPAQDARLPAAGPLVEFTNRLVHAVSGEGQRPSSPPPPAGV
jgi:hypothetical protein